MKKKLSKRELETLEKEMRDASLWADADHVVVYEGPTSIRFSFETLRKLRAIAKAKQKPINRLVNDYVKAFVDEEFVMLQKLARKAH